MSAQNSPFKLATTCQNQIMALYQAKIRQQNQFLEFIKTTLVAPLAEHLLYCVISGKKLLLYTDTEEWAIQLRHHQQMILNAIANSSLASVDLIRVRLISQSVEQRSSHSIKLPSKQNIELIRDNLQSIKDDELKLALLRLSQTLDRLS